MQPAHNAPHQTPLLLTDYEKRLKIRNKPQFHQTNEDWNVLKLNQSWVIGSLNHIFRTANPKTHEAWERVYFASGEVRKTKLKLLSPEKQAALQNFIIPDVYNESAYARLTAEEKTLNTHYGRTKSDLIAIANFFHKELLLRKPTLILSPKHSFDYVRIRVIDETFIGFQREIKTFDNLVQRYPNLDFNIASSEMDTLYAIDAEATHDGKLLFAIQIKSSKYLHSQLDIMKQVKKMNHHKNANYESRFGVPVLYVYARVDGTIENTEALTYIERLIPKPSN